ncbi:MAG: phytanoyl-CoA dioxygenase family protein [Proteobacteria bacterium]|nr:phytanoyl-CoA dioxygenase family protein [Pseudomonadota bacterium]
MISRDRRPAALRGAFEADGFAIIEGVFGRAEIDALVQHFMRLRAEGPKPLDFVGEDSAEDDPLRAFPRMVHMHRWDATSLRWMLDERLGRILTVLLGAEPYAVQSMIYFKPPGSRGQALHQDQEYLHATPGTCVGAWLALDPATEASGCLRLAPGTGPLEPHGTTRTDTSFTNVGVERQDRPTEAAVMEPGDLLVFVGSVVHGSLPNTSSDFRRALIGHYVTADCEQVHEFYLPALRFDGTTAPIGPLGTRT